MLFFTFTRVTLVKTLFGLLELILYFYQGNLCYFFYQGNFGKDALRFTSTLGLGLIGMWRAHSGMYICI
jgi:hypothetical protein